MDMDGPKSAVCEMHAATMLRECRRRQAQARADYWWPLYLRFRRMAAAELELMDQPRGEAEIDAYLDNFAFLATMKKLKTLFECDRNCRRQLGAARVPEASAQ